MKNCTPASFKLRVYGVLLFALLAPFSIYSQVQNTESFDGTTFPPTGWQQGGSNTTYLFQTGSGTHPTQNPHSGSGQVEFNSYSLTGNTLLISPVVDWGHLGTDSATISFWFYRDGVSYNTTTYDSEGVKLLVNTSATDVGARQLAFVPRRIGETPVVASTGWYQYSYSVPRTFNTATNYFIFKFIGEDGDNCFLDDVSWQSFPTPCSGVPSVGTITTSASAVCAGNAVTLTLNNSTVAGGITFKWQSSPDSLTWATIAGDTTALVSVTPASTTYYRAIITCSFSGLSDTSAAIRESLNSYVNCYCTPGSTNCNSSDEITNVSFANINNTTACGTNGYSQYTDTGIVYKTLTYPLSVYVNNGGTENVVVWIDYDHSGTFDTTEYTVVGSGTGGTTFSTNITIPANALTGLTVMRVRDQYSTLLPANSPCTATSSYGETEDYLINILPAPICSNPPVAGTIAGASQVCPGTGETLTLNGQTLGTNIQWQSSTDTLTWTDIPGAVNSTYTTGNLTDSVYYRVEVICVDTTYTPVYKVTIKPGYLCYCAEPGIGGATLCDDGYDINSVSITGTPLFTVLVCNITNGHAYTQFPASGSSTATLDAPATYTINATGTDVGGYMAAWIDFNHDGTFSANESIFVDASTTGTQESFTFNIPSNATFGPTGLRVRASSSTITANDACTSLSDGETEDYIVNIVAAPACSGTPAAGTVTSTVNPVCPAVTYTLSVQNSTIAGSLTYQWQSSSDSLVWSNLTNDTANTLSLSGLNASTYYRLIVKCGVSGFADTSAGYLEVSNSFANCYCVPAAYCGASDVINQVTFAGINNSSGCSSTGYTLYNDTAVVDRTVTYPISVGVDNGGTENVYVWIDYNQNGAFDSTEYTFIGSGTGGVTFNGNVTIPSNAVLGITHMRVRNRYGSTPLTANDACLDVTDGETEDYLVNILAAPICTNPPSPGLISGPGVTCPGTSVTLSIANQTLGTILHWQSSTDSLTFTDIPSAIYNNYTTAALTDSMYYRVKVICADSSYTNVIKVGISPAYLCSYCDVSGSYCGFGDAITNVTFAGINNTTACAGSGYTIYSSPVAQVQRLVSYTLSVALENTYVGGGVWIDYDHSGSFDSNEFIPLPLGGGTVTVNIPATATLGITGLRVMSNDGGTPASTDGCTTFSYGETEDYLINIGLAPPCTTTPVAGVVSGADSVSSGTTHTYTATGTAGTLQWIVATDSAGPYSAISGATADTLAFTPSSGGDYWIAVVAGGPGCYPDTSAAIHVLSIFHGDDVCDAIPLHFGGNGPFNTTSATVQTGEPAAPGGGCQVQGNWCNSTIHNTLWFTFVAPASGRISINTVGFDTKLAVWGAVNCDTILHGGATLLGASDDDPNYSVHGDAEFSSYIDSVTCLTPGKVYYVQMLPYSSPGDTTSIMLRDLGPGPHPAFTLASKFCLPATPITLVDTLNSSAIFSGPGVRNSTFYPDSAGVGGPYLIVDSLYGCYKAVDTVTITPGAQITINHLAEVKCHGDATGSIKVTASNGTPAYHYNWSNGATTDSLANLHAGTYVLVVTDSAGCISHPDSITITQPALLTATLAGLNNVTCSGGTNGSASVTAAGGTTPYHFSWNNGATTSSITNVAAGTYVFHLTDSLGCSAPAVTVQLTEPDTFVISVDTLTNIAACSALHNGAITVSATGGNPGYSFVWSTGASTATISGLSAGQYVVSAIDTLGCNAVPDTIQVIQLPGGVTVNTTIVDQQQGAFGSITQTPSGGTAPYTFAWSNGATTQNLTGITAGVYVSTVTDAGGCSVITSDTVKLILGIEVINGSLSLSIFPNPTQNEFFVDIDLAKADDITLQVYDMSGRLVVADEQRAVAKARFDVNMQTQAAGVYLAKITAGETVVTRRIVLTK